MTSGGARLYFTGFAHASQAGRLHLPDGRIMEHAIIVLRSAAKNMLISPCGFLMPKTEPTLRTCTEGRQHSNSSADQRSSAPYSFCTARSIFAIAPEISSSVSVRSDARKVSA